MRTVLVVTADSAQQARMLRTFSGCSVFVAPNDGEALKTLRLVDVDAVFRESRRPAPELGPFVAAVKSLRPTAMVVAIGAPEEESEAADLTLPAAFGQRDLDAVIRQITDRRRLLYEVATLRAQLAASRPAEGAGANAVAESPRAARILKEFTRVLAAGFDLPRMLDMFLDAIGELLRPSRSALLLLDDRREAFRIRASRGLAPQIVASVRLPAAEGLGRWLSVQGRPARLQDLSDPDLARELLLVGGVLVAPLLAQGELMGILVVGQPVAGCVYGRQEVEILFDLASHLATAIRDVGLHHQLHHEKEFTERILAHMSSGVVTIGRDERVGTINRRAEEVLGLRAAEVVGQDLRVLPSPLGDMLFETLAHGRARPATEIQLPGRNLWLEVSTYPIRGDETAALGAVLVLDDRTAQKELAARKRQAEEFQLLARVVARIADEIKNPLVSISTFVELIEERFDDPDFRKRFSSVVRRDARRLVQVFEKLAGLVSEGELHCTTVDLHEVLDDVVTTVQLSDDALGKRLQLDVERAEEAHPVKVDAAQLRKALSYLIWFLTHNSPVEEARVSLAVSRHAERGEPEGVRILIASRTASVAPEKLTRLFDPVQMVQESLIDVGPAVSQRLIEAQGGRLQVRQGRQDVAFQVTLPHAR